MLTLLVLLQPACDSEDPNEAPSFLTIAPVTAIEGQKYLYTVRVFDDDRISLTLVAGPGWLDLVQEGDRSATLSGTPTRNDVGSVDVTIRVSDRELTADQTFTIRVGYGFGGVYETDKYTITGFFSNCHRSESRPGAFYRVALTPFGQATVSQGYQGQTQTEFSGPYVVSGDTLTIENTVSLEYSIFYAWVIDSPKLRHLHTSSLPDGCQPVIELTRIADIVE